MSTELDVQPTVAPMTTDVAPVPAVAPLNGDVPPAVTPESHGRGRIAGPQTIMIRSLLADSDGSLTFATAEPLLKAAGFECDSNTFNVTKSAWVKARKPQTDAKPAQASKPRKARKASKPEKVSLPEVTIEEAIAFVQNAGGYAKAEQSVLRSRALLKAFRQLVKQTSKLAA